MIQQFQEFVAGQPDFLGYLFLILISAIPFVESYFGSAIGVISGMNLFLSILFASLGNFISMFILVTFSNKFNEKFLRKRLDKKRNSKKMQRFNRIFDKYGIAGVSLLGQTLLPSQITSALMAVAGADKKKIIFWQTISILLWGTAFGLLAAAGVNILV